MLPEPKQKLYGSMYETKRFQAPYAGVLWRFFL